MRWFVLDRIDQATATTHECGEHTVDEVGAQPVTARPVIAPPARADGAAVS